ncbi:MAG: toll/interleukin-1 receptor domain-containing protein [bacterium]|nr:toll/interleukin-1 receptor domain-containing protein [bacterium]
MMGTVFISYSHKDEAWKERVVKHLDVLKMQGNIDAWDDRRIKAGEKWFQEIEKTLKEADAAVLLISPDFLTSAFILNQEVPWMTPGRITVPISSP